MKKRIEWEADMTPEEQELKWMREFAKKPFDEKFRFLCKIQMMGSKPNDPQRKGKRIEWP
jgi:hypothetical protein